MNRNRKSRTGVTLIEVMIAIAILCLLLVVVSAVFRGCLFADTQRENADAAARTWVAEMYPEVPADGVHIICQGTDNDGNGYVTCSARVGEEHLSLECYAYVVLNPGDNTCREVSLMRQPGTRR